MSASGSGNEDTPPVSGEVIKPTPKRAFKDVRPTAGKKPARAPKAEKALGKKARTEKFEAVTELPSGFFSHAVPCSHCGSDITVDSSIPLTFSRGSRKAPGHRFVTKVGGSGVILIVAICVRCNNGLLQKIDQGIKTYLAQLREIAGMADLHYRIDHAAQWKLVNEEKQADLITSLASLRKMRQDFLNSGEDHAEEVSKLDKMILSRYTEIEELRTLITTTPTTPEGVAREKARLAARKEELDKLTAEYRWKIRKYNNVREDGMTYTTQDFSAARRIGVPTLENPTIVISTPEPPAAPAVEAPKPVPKATPAPAATEDEEVPGRVTTFRRRQAPKNWGDS